MSRLCPHPKVRSETAIERELDIGTGAGDERATADADRFCHISSGDGRTAYCGHPVGGKNTCKIFDGEAICPSCGLPTCPSCAVMSSLHDRLVDDEETS